MKLTPGVAPTKFLGPVNTDTGEWAPGIGSKNPYDRVAQASAWEMYDRSNRYFEQAVAERILHPEYALQLQGSALDMRTAARYIVTLARDAKAAAKAAAKTAAKTKPKPKPRPKPKPNAQRNDRQSGMGTVRARPPAPRPRR